NRGGLVEAETVGARGVEIVVPLIRVADLIDGEVVEVPDPSLLHVRPPRFRRDAGRDLTAYQVRRFVGDVDHRRLEERAPDAAFRTGRARAAVGGSRGCSGCGLRGCL